MTAQNAKETTQSFCIKRFIKRQSRIMAGAFVISAIALMFMDAGAFAQSLSVDLGDNGTITGRVVQMILLLTVLSVAPSILIMVTSFTRMVIVFSLLRSALGTQQTPPNIVLVSLAMFLTAFVMAPTFETAYKAGLEPLIEEEIGIEEAMPLAVAPFKTFMLTHVRDKDLMLFLDMSNSTMPANPQDVALTTLIPSFMISELRRAFEIGFLLYIPFLVIDLVVASILMAMGMMMVPPVMLSLPFKLIFFVLVDGWNLVAGSLVRSFGGG